MTKQYLDHLLSDPRIDNVRIRYDNKNIPFNPIFESIADHVTSGIEHYETSTIIHQIVVLLEDALVKEIKKCKSQKWWVKAGQFLLGLIGL